MIPPNWGDHKGLDRQFRTNADSPGSILCQLIVGRIAMRPYEQEGFEWGFFGLKWMKNGEFVGAHGNAPATSYGFHRSIYACREYAIGVADRQLAASADLLLGVLI